MGRSERGLSAPLLHSGRTANWCPHGRPCGRGRPSQPRGRSAGSCLGTTPCTSGTEAPTRSTRRAGSTLLSVRVRVRASVQTRVRVASSGGGGTHGSAEHAAGRHQGDSARAEWMRARTHLRSRHTQPFVSWSGSSGRPHRTRRRSCRPERVLGRPRELKGGTSGRDGIISKYLLIHSMRSDGLKI